MFKRVTSSPLKSKVVNLLRKWVFFINSRNFRVPLFSILTLTILLFPFQSALSETQIPRIISYQGRLYDNEGNLLGDEGTSFYFRFSIWNANATGTKLWPAGVPNIVPLNVEWGVFNASLGDASLGFDPLTLNFTESNYYLQIEVAALPDFSDAETLSPRQRIVSSGYAINTATLGGFKASQTPQGSQIPVLDEQGRLVFYSDSGGIKSATSSPLTIQGDSIDEIYFFNASNKLSPSGDLTIGGKINKAIISGGTLTGGFYGGKEIIPEENFVIGTSTLSLTLNTSELIFETNRALFKGQILLGGFISPPEPSGIGSVYYDLSQNDSFLWTGSDWASLTRGGGMATATLQSAYDYSPTPAEIKTSDNKDLRITLQDTSIDSNFLINLLGSDSSFQILRTGSPYLTALNFKNQIQIGSGVGINNPTLLILDTKNTNGDPLCVNGAIYYNSFLNKFRACENGRWKSLKLK